MITEGMKTSEFMVLIALLCFAVIALALGEKDVAMVVLGAAGVTGGGYAISRGLVKGGE